MNTKKLKRESGKRNDFILKQITKTMTFIYI